MPFKNLGLTDALLQAIDTEGYTQPTPIQQQSIPHVLAGKDILGCAQTGTGKTAAFALPIIQRLLEHPRPHKKQAKHHERAIRCLVLSPTRELAAQIGASFTNYSAETNLRNTVIFGGVKQGSQTRALRDGIDILVATPGRLIDLIGQGHVDLKSVEIFVLDEADRMLDMGFINDIYRILNYVPEKRQTLLFSATMPQKIQSLADSLLHEPIDVRIAPEAPAAENVDQQIYLVEGASKTKLLEHVLEGEDISRVLIFTRTKRRADRLLQDLQWSNIKADVIHADRPQHARERALENFRSGKTPILIASDIAARGLDVDEISHVINFELPQEAEVYVHRIGRTGRAGAKGIAMSFCDVGERLLLDEIETLLGCEIPVIQDHPYVSALPRKTKQAEAEPAKPAPLFNTRRPARKRRL